MVGRGKGLGGEIQPFTADEGGIGPTYAKTQGGGGEKMTPRGSKKGKGSAVSALRSVE